MIPERPILHPRCHIVRRQRTFALRRGSRVLYLEDARRLAFAERLIAVLDGRSLGNLVQSVSRTPNDRVEALLLLRELGHEGFLVPLDAYSGNLEPAATTIELECAPRWQDLVLHVVDSGGAAGHLFRALRRAGVSVESIRQDEQLRGLTVLCLDTPDLHALAAWNHRAVQSRLPFVVALPLGDEIIFCGPLTGAGGPCTDCLFLRLSGIASHVPVERSFLAQIAADSANREIVDDPTARALAIGLFRFLDAHFANDPPRPLLEITDRTTGRVSRHRLLAHPACKLCGSGDGRGSADAALAWRGWRSEDNPPHPPHDAALALLAPVTDDRVGLVATPSTVGDPEDGRDLHVATARFADFHPELVVSHRPSLSCGMAAEAQTASLIARIEALERYCLGASLRAAATGPYESLSEDAIDPAEFPLHSERQAEQPDFPFARFDPRRPLTWVWGYDLVAGRPRLLPEEAASSRLARARLFATTSNGIAAHWSAQVALLSAALELIERDAFMIHWLLRLAPPLLDSTGTEAAFPAAFDEIRAGGYEVVLADLSLDLAVPVVVAFGLGSDPDKPALLLGAAAALEPAAAAAKAVRELRGAVRSWKSRQLSRRDPLALDEIRHLEDHAAAYAHPEWRDRASFLWSRSQLTTLERMPNLDSGQLPPLARLVDELRLRQLALVAIDLTTPDVATTGLHVVRAVIPGLQPLGFGPFAARLGGRRPYEIAARFGLSPAESELNTDPHCFP